MPRWICRLMTLIQARACPRAGNPRCEAMIDTAKILNHVGPSGVFRCVHALGHELIPNGQDDRPPHLHPAIGLWWY